MLLLEVIRHIHPLWKWSCWFIFIVFIGHRIDGEYNYHSLLKPLLKNLSLFCAFGCLRSKSNFKWKSNCSGNSLLNEVDAFLSVWNKTQSVRKHHNKFYLPKKSIIKHLLDITVALRHKLRDDILEIAIRHLRVSQRGFLFSLVNKHLFVRQETM